MKKIFSYIFLAVIVLSTFLFWHFFHNLTLSLSWLNFIVMLASFIFLMAFEMLLFSVSDSKLFFWVSFMALVLSFLSEFGFVPVYILAIVLSLIAFLISKKTVNIDASKGLKFSFWQMAFGGAKVYVISVIILISAALFSFSPQMILRSAGLDQVGINYGFKLAQKILSSKIPYFSPDLTGQQFALLYIFDQAQSHTSISESEQFLPASIRSKLKSRNLNLFDFVKKPNVASQNKDILNSIVSFAKIQPGFEAQEKAFLDQLGLPYSAAEKPIAGVVSDLILSQVIRIWPQYGFIISLILAIFLFLFLQSIRYWLALPGIFLGMFVVWLMRKFGIMDLKIEKVDKEELIWK